MWRSNQPSPKQIEHAHNNFGINYLSSHGQYNSADNLKIYYDMKNIILANEYDYQHGKVLDLANFTFVKK